MSEFTIPELYMVSQDQEPCYDMVLDKSVIPFRAYSAEEIIAAKVAQKKCLDELNEIKAIQAKPKANPLILASGLLLLLEFL